MIYSGGDIYIDTSLITCAEYQLFLDQQRSYGHFLQPDHWKTTSFPKGQGRAPILGIRSSDALAFCAWLNERDPGIWQYCLPLLNKQQRLETDKNLMISTQEYVGYWIENGKTFAWIRNGSPPTDVIINMTQEVFELNKITLPLHALSGACNRNQILDLEHIWNRVAALTLRDILDPTYSHAHTLLEARYANHTNAQKLVENITRDRDSLYILVGILQQEMTEILKRTSKYTTLDYALSCSCKLVNIFYQVQKLGLWGNEALLDAYECCLDLTVNLILLNARIKGKMPAQEGILLARKRII